MLSTYGKEYKTLEPEFDPEKEYDDLTPLQKKQRTTLINKDPINMSKFLPGKPTKQSKLKTREKRVKRNKQSLQEIWE